VVAVVVIVVAVLVVRSRINNSKEQQGLAVQKAEIEEARMAQADAAKKTDAKKAAEAEAAQKAEAKKANELFEANLEAFASSPTDAAAAWIQLLVPEYKERAIRRLVELHFPRYDEGQEVIDAAGKYIYEIGGDRALDIVWEYTNEKTHSVVMANHARAWCLKYRTVEAFNRLDALEVKTTIVPAPAPTPAPVVASPALAKRPVIKTRLDK
jgi:thioesterase domain-containing protein